MLNLKNGWTDKLIVFYILKGNNIRVRFFIFIVLSFIYISPARGQVGELIWQDEFNNGALDLSKWSYETGTGVNGDFGTGQDEKAVHVIDGRRTGVSEYSNHFNQWYPFEHKMFIILSAGVGGSEYTYGGPIVPEAEFPCSVFIDWVRVYEIGENSLGINNINNTPKINIYPNPANNLLSLQINDNKEYSVRILDLSGRNVLSTRINRSGTIDISGIKTGEYIVLISDGKLTISKKIIKK